GIGMLCIILVVSPRIFLVGITTACSKLPLGFSWQSLSCPLAIGYCIIPGNMNNRIVVSARNGAPGSQRMFPVCPGKPRPPLAKVIERYRVVGWIENQRSGNQY